MAAAQLASRQHGIVTRQQLLEAGASSATISRRVRSRRLQPVHRGVYLLGPIRPAHAPEMAACLACSRDAVLSHVSAAVVWQILSAKMRRPVVDITTARRLRPRHGIRLHHPRTLDPRETTRCKGIPITTPERTLFDLASSISLRDLERALAESYARRLTTAEKVAGVLDRHCGRRGYRRLRDLVQGGRLTRTRSAFEEQFLAMVKRAKLGKPKVNMKVAGYEVDFYWPRENVVFETDGFAFHSSRRSFEDDRRRDLALAAGGVQVVRVSWEQWEKEREAVLAALAGTLARAAERRTIS